MASEKIKVRIRRVLAGEVGAVPLGLSGFVSSKYPEDGYVLSHTGSGAVPLYVTDHDIEAAWQKRDEGNDKWMEIDTWRNRDV